MIQLEREGVQLLTPGDASYPRLLNAVPGPPLLICVRGEVAAVNDTPVAVFGTKSLDRKMREETQELAGALAGKGYTVATSLTDGIELAAHRAARSAGGWVLGFEGGGAGHRLGLRDRDEDAAARTIEMWEVRRLDGHWDGYREAERRDRALVAAMSTATVVVDAGPISGKQIPVRYIADIRRPLIINRRLAGHPWADEVLGGPSVFLFDGVEELLAVLEDVAPCPTY